MLFELARIIIWSAKCSHSLVVNRKRHAENIKRTAKELMVMAANAVMYLCIMAAAWNALIGGGIVK